MRKPSMLLFVSCLSLVTITGCGSNNASIEAQKKNAVLEVIGGIMSAKASAGDCYYTRVNAAANYKKVAPLNITLPSKVDLRERGIVSPIKDQGGFGTCWSFGSGDSITTSILRNANLTYDQYTQARGHTADISTKQIAYFNATTLPEKTNDPYLYTNFASQAGEGTVYIEDKVSSAQRYSRGGMPKTVVDSLTNYIGCIFESDLPYTANDGTVKFTDSKDWSVDESLRFKNKVELQKAIYFPNPSEYVDEKTTKFNKDALNYIKRALNENNAVAVDYACIDSSYIPSQAVIEGRSAKIELALDKLGVVKNYTDIQIAEATKFFYTTTGFNEFSKEMQKAVREILCYYLFGNIEQGSLEAFDNQYVNIVHSFNVYTGAYYCSHFEIINHEVVIVGYDDNYPKENFVEGNQPEGDGAWIVKNSWGEVYGDKGYFYLSYYDQTARDFYTLDVIEKTKENVPDYLYSHSFGDAFVNQQIDFDDKVKYANVFEITRDCTIDSLSFDVGYDNSDVNYSIYRLKKGNNSIDKGTLLYSKNNFYTLPGTFREFVSNDKEIKLNKGDKVAVVLQQKSGDEYTIVSNLGGTKELEKLNLGSDFFFGRAVINKGESLIYKNGLWIDYKDVVEPLKKSDIYYYRDNFAIKLVTK